MTLAAALLALNLAQPYPPPPPYYPPPPPRYYPPPPQVRAPPYEPRGMVGLVLMPLGASSLHSDLQGYNTYSDPHGAVALELRGQHGGGRLRLGFELTPHDRIVDASLKYNFLDWAPLQPFFTIGLGAGNLGPETVWRGAVSASVGLDFYLTRNFFFTAEAKGRAFANLSSSDPANVYGQGVTMAVALFGAGVYF